MKTFRVGTLALPALGSALLISSCIADGDATSVATPSEAGAAGEHTANDAGAGNAPEGGSAGASDEIAAGAAGRETTARGGGGGGGASGRGGTGGGGSSPTHAGENGVTGGAAGAHDFGGQTGAGASGGVPGSGGEPASGEAGSGGSAGLEPLAICMRLTSPAADALYVNSLYWQATTHDCRISWVSRLYRDEVDTFLNWFLRWSLAFWGCPGTEPPENFGLMYVEMPATSADTEILIDYYMDAAISTLEPSPDELDAMRRHLERLAQRVIERETDELSNSTCVDGAGGDGGQP